MKKTIKQKLLIIAVVVVAAGVIYTKSMPMIVETAVINPKTAELSFTEQGIVLAQRHVAVYTTVPARIVSLDVIEGQYVEQGDILCIVDTSQTTADLLRAIEREATIRQLFSSGFYSRQDLLDAEKATRDIERALMDTIVRAPVSGIVSRLNIKDTNIVNTQIPIAVITAERDCIVETYVSAKDISAIEHGKRVFLILESRYENKEITGTIIYSEDYAEVRISVLGVEERKIKVTIAPDECSELKDGFDVDVRFNYYYEENKFTVPKTAVFKENDTDMIWIVSGGRAQKIQVLKGMELRTEFVIENGLSEGGIVIVDSNIKGLKDGMKVSRKA